MRKLSFGPLAAVARVVLPALALAAGAAASQAQCTGFTITSSTGATIVPGTNDIGNHADDLLTAVTIPFPVNLYGAGYTTAQASSNGNLQFTGNMTNAWGNDCLSASGGQVTGVAIFPHWDDQRTDAAGSGIFTSTTGVTPNRIFNIEWRVTYYDGSGAASYELRLFEDNTHFEVIYGAMVENGSSATVGVQNGTGLFNQYECNTGGLSAGQKLTFTPINGGTVICASGAASPGTVNIGNGAQNTLLTVTASPATPPSTGLAGTVDLSSMGGSSTQPLYNDGTHGDVTAGDNILSYQLNVPANATTGTRTFSFAVHDDQLRTGGGTINLIVTGPPHPALGPDVVTYDVTDVTRWGTDATGTITAYSVGTTSSNEGDYPVLWVDGSPSYAPDFDQTEQPAISQNMYRFKSYGAYSRFEHLGQSWLKHGFVSTNSPGPQGCDPSLVWRPSLQNYQNFGGDALGVHCTDTYGSGLNGSQGNLGAKNIVNATTGFSPYVLGNGTGDATIKERLQVPTADVAAQPAGTRFFVDAYYCTQDDSQFVRPGQTVAFNALNNASWREVMATTISSANPAFSNLTQLHNPGIFAWQVADPTVTLVTADHTDTPNPGTGFKDPNGAPSFPGTTIRARFWVAAKATSLGGGLYRYEYAVYNHNSDRSAQAFTVPVPASATVTDVTFHAPMWHSGEPYSNTAWTNARSGNAITFSTQTYAANQNANALRWAEMFNFGFTTNVAPTSGNATITLFKPGTVGSPASIAAAAIPVPIVPPPCGSADFNCDGDVGTDADIAGFFSCLSGNCPAAPCANSADFNGDGDVGTDADIEAFFRVLGGGTC
jgi:hypothetical protein